MYHRAGKVHLLECLHVLKRHGVMHRQVPRLGTDLKARVVPRSMLKCATKAYPTRYVIMSFMLPKPAWPKRTM